MNCPKCGSGVLEKTSWYVIYFCGSSIIFDVLRQTNYCWKKELDDRLAEACQLLKEVAWRSQVHPSDCDCDVCEKVDRFLKKEQTP